MKLKRHFVVVVVDSKVSSPKDSRPMKIHYPGKTGIARTVLKSVKSTGGRVSRWVDTLPAEIKRDDDDDDDDDDDEDRE